MTLATNQKKIESGSWRGRKLALILYVELVFLFLAFSLDFQVSIMF